MQIIRIKILKINFTLLELITNEKYFIDVFEVISNVENSSRYELLGAGKNAKLDISKKSRMSIISGFLDILLKWFELKEHTIR